MMVAFICGSCFWRLLCKHDSKDAIPRTEPLPKEMNLLLGACTKFCGLGHTPVIRTTGRGSGEPPLGHLAMSAGANDVTEGHDAPRVKRPRVHSFIHSFTHSSLPPIRTEHLMCQGWSWAILHQVVSKGCSEKVTFAQTPAGMKEQALPRPRF